MFFVIYKICCDFYRYSDQYIFECFYDMESRSKNLEVEKWQRNTDKQHFRIF